MSMIRVLATTVACVFALSCSAPSSPKFALKAAERRGRLESNGLRFVIMPDDTTQLAQVDIRYDVGAREDPPGRAGLAHLVEHIMFQTRPDGPNTPPIFQTILDIATDMNAYTIWDMTHYHMASRTENLDAMLKIEAMRMYYGCQNIPEGEFEREREVVRNEIRAQSSAEGQVVQYVEAAFYPKGHAYERMVGGNDEQIASASLQEVCDFMKKYYTPDRAVLLVAGGVDVDGTIEMIKKWFAKIPKRDASPRVDVKPFTVTHDKKVIEADVERPMVFIGWPLPAANTPEGELARFGIGRLVGEIAQKSSEYEFAYGVGADFLGGELAPLFIIEIELKDMSRLDEALEFAQKSAKQAYRGFDMAGYEANESFRKRSQAQFVQSLERLSNRTETVATMVQFSKDFDFDSTDMYLFHQLDKIAKFDIAKTSAVVKKYLAWENSGIVVVKPGTKGIGQDKRSNVKYSAKSDAAFTDPPVDPAEAKRPIRNAGQLKNLDAAQRFKMKNGMDVVLLPMHAMPLATASLVFKNAGDASTPSNPLLAAMAAEFLDFPMDAEVFGATGIGVNCGTTDDYMQCNTRGINIYLDVMMKGLERKIKAGTYSQDGIEEWQKGVKAQFKLHSVQEQNEYIRQVVTALYGPEHAYTKTAVLTPEYANKIHKDALDDFRDQHYRAGNATLIVVGDFDAKYAEKLAKDTFGDWSTGTIDKPVDKNAAKRTGPAYVGVTKNKVDQQITVTLAYPAPGGIDGQEAAREVLTRMLGIRAEDIRFKLGSTYGLTFARQTKVGPTSYMLRGGAVLGGTIDAERAGESIKVLRESLDALRNGDSFDEHFVRARRKLLQELLTESTVTGELAARLGKIAIYNLDPNHYNTLIQQIAAVSPAQVKALIKQELNPQNEVLIMLGDRDHLNKTFKDVGITDVKIIDPDYK
ncbi:MAG TPA: pitrilysin family protein [Kofleriaceae bacterium]|nr:pitrilysin family protein [Kofleriaceae bacterium]